jgi:hypothetical protein
MFGYLYLKLTDRIKKDITNDEPARYASEA